MQAQNPHRLWLPFGSAKQRPDSRPLRITSAPCITSMRMSLLFSTFPRRPPAFRLHSPASFQGGAAGRRRMRVRDDRSWYSGRSNWCGDRIATGATGGLFAAWEICRAEGMHIILHLDFVWSDRHHIPPQRHRPKADHDLRSSNDAMAFHGRVSRGRNFNHMRDSYCCLKLLPSRQRR